MTKSSQATAERWAVSTRTDGEVLVAGVTLPSIELTLLGIPQGFTAVEIQSWLQDLAGVAVETSRSDGRQHPIPPLLHHALTGLLFSQTELWSHTGQGLPCAAVFVDGPQGVAFGWVGRARVMLLVNGEPFEPQWVIVRDEAGHQAMSALLPAGSHVLLTLEYWPNGEDRNPAPVSLDAEFGMASATQVVTRTGEMPGPVKLAEVRPEPEPEPEPAARAPAALPPLAGPPPESLLSGRPGLSPDPTRVRLDEPDAAQVLPSTRHPSVETFAMPQLPSREPAAPPSPDPAGFPPQRTEHDTSFDSSVPGASLAAGAAVTAPSRDESVAPTSPEWAARAVWPPAAEDPRGNDGTGDDPRSQWAAPPVADEAPAIAEPRHPVGRWLARLAGFVRKPAHAPVLDPPVMRDDAIVSAGPRWDTEPPPIPEPPAPPVIAFVPPVPPAPPVIAFAPPVAPPIAPPALPERRGLAASGLNEILGAHAQGPAPVASPSRQMVGLTAMSGASAPVGPQPSMRVNPAPVMPGTQPYPMLDVTVPSGSGAPGAPIDIEQEPIGADITFAIPRLPQRDAPRPVRAPLPDAPAAPAEPGAQAPSPGIGAPGGTRRLDAQPIFASHPAAPPPGPATPVSRAGAPTPAAIPEVPLEFLEQFAASIHPVMDPSLAPRATDVESAAPEPPQAPPRLPPVLHLPTPDPRLAAPSPTSAPRAPLAAVPGPAAAAPSVAHSPPRDARGPVLRTPTLATPLGESESEMSALLRELPLPAVHEELARSAPPLAPEASEDIPEGMLVAHPASANPRGPRSRLSPWPALAELAPGTPAWWQKPWLLGTLVLALFGVGWLVGHSQSPDNDVRGTPISKLLRSVGLGGTRFSATVDSDPPGAWIAVDGKELSRQTPATLELVPGTHSLTLSMPDLGSVKVALKGSAEQKLKVNESLNGSLDVTTPDPDLPVKLSLDGQPQGWLPVHIDRLPPGMHELQFSGPNMQPWGQTVNIGIRQMLQFVAKPMTSPATGVLNIQASLNDDNGTVPLSGASVFVDGDLRGATPLTIELPRGPHSLRLVYRGSTAPVQVIDLPGGNQRFATFQFGLDTDLPPLRLQGSYASLTDRKSVTVTASLDGLAVREVRESWLHARTPDGVWRRYEMTVTAGPRGAQLNAPLPISLFDEQGHLTWYLSSATAQGDEFYTEIQHSLR